MEGESSDVQANVTSEDPGLYIVAKFKNYGPTIFDELDASQNKPVRRVMKDTASENRLKDFVSEAAQTKFRDSETQFLKWDVTETPDISPDKFYRGYGLHYPVLYDPAWPVHIADRRAVPKRGGKSRDKALAVGSWALTGMTLSQKARRAVKHTLCFPHRNIMWPFRQPPTIDMQMPIFELCDKLTLQEINDIERTVLFKRVSDNYKNYDIPTPKVSKKDF